MFKLIITESRGYNENMSDYINPDDFIITRKRKKYKFAKFKNSQICYEKDEWTKRQVDVVEIGAGTGLFLVELASKHPEKTFVAIDVKGDRLQKGAYEAESRGLKNIFFIRARADQVDELFLEQSVGEIWVTFSDPFPKRRSAGRRLSNAVFLKKYKKILTCDGVLRLKHDNIDFFCYSLEQIVSEGWKIVELSFDLYDSDLDDEYKIMTTYEKRWTDEGRIINYVTARR